jgi:hypothetical protein
MESASDADQGAAAGEASFVHRPGDPWSVRRRLRVGSSLEIELVPAGGYRWWSDVQSSDAQAAEVTGAVGEDGVLRAVVSAHRAAVVTLSATTSHTGDRFGPPTRIWRMALEIVA